MPLTSDEADALLAEVQSIVASYTVGSPTTSVLPTVPSSLGGYDVVDQQALTEGFEHRWPKRANTTKYVPTTEVPTARYTVRTSGGDYSLLIGAEHEGRATHGMAGRGRIVVFVRRGEGTSNLYPLVEFAETDEPDADGKALYAAGIPKPGSPRSLATTADLPQLSSTPHLQGADIQRADEVYRGMGSGPTLRLVVKVSDVKTMLAHALWVGEMRGGGRLPRPA